MDIPFKKEPTVGAFAIEVQLKRDGGWLFIPSGENISLETRCYQQGWVSRELNDVEIDQIEHAIKSTGLRPFFEWGQLAMIIENLRLQKSDFTPELLLQAIVHYWEHDAYISIQST